MTSLKIVFSLCVIHSRLVFRDPKSIFYCSLSWRDNDPITSAPFIAGKYEARG